MKALVWHGGQSFRLEDVPPPEAERGRVVVKVEAAAVCGSDMHMDDFGAEPPLVLGHEVAGTVAEAGEGVTEVAVGDRVALDPVQRCGECWCCAHGVEHLCLNVRHLGSRGVPGGWAEYVAVDAANAHRVPKGVDFLSACLAEPLAVSCESLQRAGLREGQSVLVIGDGPFGFLHAQLARARGAGTIIVAGHHDERLERIAAGTGAVTCNTRTDGLSKVLSEHVGPPGVDVAIEATGAGAAPDVGIRALRPRGTLVVFSYIWRPAPLQMGLIHMRELNVLGSCRSLGAYRECLDLLGEGAADTGALVDVRVPLEDHANAIERLKSSKKDVFKVVFLPQV